MKSPLLIFTLILIVSWGKAQDNDTQTSPEDNQSKNTFSISFEKTKLEVKRSNDSIIIPIKVKTIIMDKENWEGYTLSIEPNPDKSTLATSEYKLEFNNWDFKNINDKSFNVFLIMKMDTIPDRDRKLVLRIKTVRDKKDVKDQNSGENKEITIVVKSSNEPLNKYNYLSYVGTNFDLVEGIKAENLFFATNVLIEPDKGKSGIQRFGVYLSIYGNRTLSSKEEFEQSVFTEIVPVTQDSSYRLSKSVKTKRSINADNLGAHLSTLHPILGSRDKGKGELKTYLTVSMDFIWRRTNISTEYGDVTRVDTLSTDSSGHHIILNPLVNNKVTFSQFDFNIGPGIFFLLENEIISFRVHGAIGYTRTFTINSRRNQVEVEKEKADIFFAGRAWITEPKTGLTLQAEVMNRWNSPKPFYGVTLSKAFNLEKLAGVFGPVTSR